MTNDIRTAPDHMDKWSRNNRLYQFLKNTGLYVEPVYHHNDHEAIEYIIVSSSAVER